ncbi:hypothetical protein CNMCM6936_005786 [Aspergillus lentulus]|uniref:Rhodopsin domain-containing protein n=1 Tax=Aspergillus lentulus TaxID=293939 RepID=A0AAN5YGD8_ASPLE|nr:hypothetical protein CNMCM6069_006238 [Aspergillus lentulus]KAF4167000.1 hypothetical protein CNMCM6936_005786 [Aspergillus lentulus]KAF4176643.1 hypothetical protein CNMCM8060_006235 [Aspergillus lentulus]KAF4185438.1 hypothetical protein CNMCM7927_006761 [Aspergillus lentulus]KAF4195931.1 hypothetical protein CNMCM8694_005673 [Aspergillus lentulus]
MGRFANSDTRDPAVNVTNWFLVVVVGLSVLIRLGTKFWIFHRLTSDDYLIIASLTFCIAQSAAISTAVSHGYGYHFATISSANFDQVMKSQYAAYILYIASLCLSKLSLSTFIRSLTPVHKDHFQAAVLQGLIAVLGVAAWNYFLSVSNIVTDCMIIAQALLLIAGIQATWKKKAVFASIFLSRVIVIVATIIEIVFSRDVRHSTDPTYDYCPTTIVSQVVQCASIVTACWGQLKPFLNQLKSNGLRIRGVDYQYSTGKGQSSRSYGRSGTNHSREEHHELVPVASGQNLTMVSASPAWDADSQSSQTGIIRETRTWVVTGDEGHPEHR